MPSQTDPEFRAIARAAFQSIDIDPEQAAYIRYHWQRYTVLIGALRTAIGDQPQRILDVGPGFQTVLTQRTFPDVQIDTAGLEPATFVSVANRTHFDLDLNLAQRREDWPHIGPYSGVVLAEVLEHLHTAPTLVLGLLSSVLEPGGWLLIQTPNPCSLANRLRMLLGRSPFEPIRENVDNPGHFHEYTLGELRSLATETGFTVDQVWSGSYFLSTGRLDSLCRRLSPALPADMQEGFTVLLRKLA